MGEERKSGNTVLLTVIGVATLLVALVGATFAYFTATVSQDTASGTVNVTTSTLAGLEMTSYKQDAKVSNAVYPGWAGYQAVQVKATGNNGDKANYNLSLTATVPAAFDDDIVYSICTVPNGTTAIATGNALDTTLGYSAGTVAKDETTPGEIHYSITGATATLPSSGCTAIGTANSALNAGSITLATNKEITVGNSATYDIYYIVYKYTNTNSEQDAQGQTFNVEPVFTINAAQNAQP